MQVDIAFHDVEYALCISTINGDTLCVEIEQKRDASRWRGDFTSRCESPTYIICLLFLSLLSSPFYVA